MPSIQEQRVGDIHVDSREFFVGPEESAWLRSRIGVMYLDDEVHRELVDVIKLSDLYEPGRTIIASIYGENPPPLPGRRMVLGSQPARQNNRAHS